MNTETLPDPQDPALRAEVAFWQDRLLGLAARVPPELPSAGLWPRIESALTIPAALGRAAAASLVPWWRRLGLWQGFSAAALAACLALSVLLVMQPPPGLAPGSRYLAVLQSPGSRDTGWVVEAQPGGRLRLVPVGTTPPVPTGRSLQFWTKAQGAAGPTSLGLVQAGQPVELPVAQLPTLENAQLFEITLEPENGSPIGRPTGPILFVGTTFRL